ncbi:MAG TPA: acyl-CoA dehydrogenase family protein, partial [Gemmatimonadaceae bacterium]|nr:acyl-CoA dehydrogenase family protein [Gemmatimonadaceae bacterium]
KLYTAKQAVALASEAVEAFGGAGYVEDTGIPRLLRDAQVLPIWEGTTNVLSLDTLRAIQKAGALPAWIADIRRRLATLATDETSTERIGSALDAIEKFFARAEPTGTTTGSDYEQTAARSIAYSIARTEAAMLLLEHARATKESAAAIAARRWCSRDLARLVEGDASHRGDSRQLLD